MKKIAIILTAFTLGLTVGCKSNSNTPEEAVNNFYTAAKDNKIEEALQYSNVPEEEQSLMAELIYDAGMVIHSFEVGESHIEEGDSTAWVTLHMVSSNAAEIEPADLNLSVPCIKVKKEWKVQLF